MNIVVLDGHTLNPGDLGWAGLEALGQCEVHDRTPPEKIAERTADAEIVLTNKTVLNRATIFQLPRLKFISVLATGFNVVDTAAARERGVPVSNVPAYGTRSVAQMTFALLLELAHRTGHHAQTVRDGRWSQCPDFCYWDFPLVELDGLTMGIVGHGRIGQAVGELARAFGMKVLANRSSPPKTVPAGVKFTDLETLFRRSDVISLHCPLTPQTKQLVNTERLDWMKPSAFLINTGRGPLVDEAALADALNAGRLAGAALDVLAVEPPPPGNPLFTAKNCLITPHIAWATRAARARLMETTVGNVRGFLEGKPQNVVN
ncbi:MAG: D-2-hydroxyacid dehydrogenase [Verrucomicrobia bacterium]|nr:D-2-hydroxyacid dehydrogenase [Verrucomicrobiota bacterium]